MKGKVVVLGILSAVAGFAAEATKVKVSEVTIVGYSCVYPNNPALGLGILGLVCTIITRIILIIVVGCCSRPSGPTSSPTSRFFNIFSWISSVIATILLLVGASLNSREGGQKDFGGTITCYVAKPGLFATGAVLSFLSAVFGIVAYVSLSSPTRTTSELDFELPIGSDFDLEKTQCIHNKTKNRKRVFGSKQRVI